MELVILEASIRRGFGRVCLLSPARWRDPTFVLQGIPDLLGNGAGNGKGQPPSQFPSFHSPNLDPPQPR